MANSYGEIKAGDIKETVSVLNQLVDFVESDISSSVTRKNFDVFVTSSNNSGTVYSVTSSLFHTIYDQNYSLQTANELFDVTTGVHYGSDTVIGIVAGGDLQNGVKLQFPNSSLMMREKVNIYRQYSQILLGDSLGKFKAPFSSANSSDEINEALFISFKRLFARDGIKRESFAMRLFQSSSSGASTDAHPSNLHITAINPASGSIIITDVGSATSIERSNAGGDVGNLVNATDSSQTVGLIFYQQGIAILDMRKAFNYEQKITGSIATVDGASSYPNFSGSFIPEFYQSASINQILDHVCETRFSSGSNTFLTFQNNTKINSSLVFCRAQADDFNYSSNPTYTNSEGRIVVIDENNTDQKAFSFVTTVGLYDANEELLAVAKLSRPVEKNDEKDLTFRVRLDF